MSLTQQQLLDYLDSDDNQYGLDSIATHGFLTATVVGNSSLDWLSAMFEGQQASVPAEVKEALQVWQNELNSQLKNEQPIELPFAGSLTNDAESDTEEETIDFSPESDVSAWAVGFVDAMFATEEDSWFNDEDTEDDVAMLTLPMMVLSGIDEDDETLQELRGDEELLVQMVNQIEGNLTELFLLFHTDD